MCGEHFGTHVGNGARQRVAVHHLSGGVAPQGAAHLYADAKVGDDEVTIGVLKDVVGLDVMVQDVLSVEISQTGTHIVDELP